jgi:hypothetical protein
MQNKDSSPLSIWLVGVPAKAQLSQYIIHGCFVALLYVKQHGKTILGIGQRSFDTIVIEELMVYPVFLYGSGRGAGKYQHRQRPSLRG